MDRVYQVFVSSTYADLSDERRQVSETLAKAGFIPAGMELFPAADQQQLEFIKRIIDRCDYYVVIIGGRYGSLADDNLSFTEKEYEYAASRGIPILAFLHGNPEKIEVGKTDQDSLKASQLSAFRERLANGRLVNFWTAPHELCTKVVISVVNATTLSPGIGWIRGDQAADVTILQELERLRVENERLSTRLHELEEVEISFSSQTAGPDELVNLTVSIHEQKPNAKPTLLSKESIAISLGSLFCEIFDRLLPEPSEYLLQGIVANASLRLSNIEKPSGARPEVARDVVRHLGYHYEALGLIKLIGAISTMPMIRDEYIKWTITEKGRRFVTFTKAIPVKKTQ